MVQVFCLVHGSRQVQSFLHADARRNGSGYQFFKAAGTDGAQHLFRFIFIGTYMPALEFCRLGFKKTHASCLESAKVRSNGYKTEWRKKLKLLIKWGVTAFTSAFSDPVAAYVSSSKQAIEHGYITRSFLLICSLIGQCNQFIAL